MLKAELKLFPCLPLFLHINQIKVCNPVLSVCSLFFKQLLTVQFSLFLCVCLWLHSGSEQIIKSRGCYIDLANINEKWDHQL